jgi:HD superfamily phosphohydrolase
MAPGGGPADYSAMHRSVTIRDPVWNTIRVDANALRVVDAPAFQRLRYIKQLGHAHLVYPGATHTRFDHALGVYHLTGRALDILARRGVLERADPLDAPLVRLAGLLHDIGHYPFSHALEELPAGRIPGHHEALVGRFLSDDGIALALSAVTPDAAVRVEALIRGTATSPLQGLVSGSLDLDKIEYLKRDARFCGVPYGEVDVDRLLEALTLARDPGTGRWEVAVHEKGVAALESLLFAKYQMFRNVYWHHAVRAATVLYKRIVADALAAAIVTAEELVGQTDDGLLHLLAARVRDGSGPAATRVGRWLEDLDARRLPKRLAEVSAADVTAAHDWIDFDATLTRAAEDGIARELGLDTGEVFLDFPEKSAMFGLDLLIERRTGEVLRLGPGGRAGLIGLPQIADELYRTARVLRLFARGGGPRIPGDRLAALAGLDGPTIRSRLQAGQPLLARG